MKQGTDYYFYQNDHLGTPQKLTAINGAVVWAAKYSSFGKANIEVETIENNLRFSGQYEDQETGLHYNLNRYYDPKAGRYLTSDPIGLEGGINLYTYALNNTVNTIDSLGLWMTKKEANAYMKEWRKPENVRARKELRKQEMKKYFNSPAAKKFMNDVYRKRNLPQSHDPTKPWGMTESYDNFRNGYVVKYMIANKCPACVVSCFIHAAVDIPFGELYTQVGTQLLKKYALKKGMELAGKVLIPYAGYVSTARSVYVFYTCTVENCFNNE